MPAGPQSRLSPPQCSAPREKGHSHPSCSCARLAVRPSANFRIRAGPSWERVQMAEHRFRFEDGAAYDRMMGAWSRLVGAVFLDWVAPRSGLRWIEVGCGSGAFTKLLCERCAPAKIEGSIRPRRSSRSHVRGREYALPNFAWVRQRRFPSRKIASGSSGMASRAAVRFSRARFAIGRNTSTRPSAVR